jgi:phosphonate transport system substrate-binding protein
MPELHLRRNGVDPRQDIAEVFVGTHESALVSVATGATAAACTWPAAWTRFQEDRPELAQKIEVRWRTDGLPHNALIARSDLPETVRSKVAAAFFGLSSNPRGHLLLEAAGCRGFVPASRETYLPVARFIAQYEEAVRPLKGLHE